MKERSMKDDPRKRPSMTPEGAPKGWYLLESDAKALIRRENWKLDQGLSDHILWQTYVSDRGELLVMRRRGASILYASRDEVLEQRGKSDRDPFNPHPLDGLLPQGARFIEAVPALIDELAKLLAIPRDALDGSIESLELIDAAVSKIRPLRRILYTPNLFAGVVAYVGEVMRKKVDGTWKLGDWGGGTYDPRIETSENDLNPWLVPHILMIEGSKFYRSIARGVADTFRIREVQKREWAAQRANAAIHAANTRNSIVLHDELPDPKRHYITEFKAKEMLAAGGWTRDPECDSVSHEAFTSGRGELLRLGDHGKSIFYESRQAYLEYRQAWERIPHGVHMLTGLLPQGPHFIEAIPSLIDELAKLLGLPREVLDASIESLHAVDEALKKVRPLKQIIYTPNFFAALIAYVGEVMRKQVDGYWRLREVPGGIYEPYIHVGPELHPHLDPFSEIYKALYDPTREGLSLAEFVPDEIISFRAVAAPRPH